MDTITNPVELIPQKPSKIWKIIFIIFLVLSFLFSGLFFLYIPLTIAGSDNSLFQNGTIYFGDKITYLFRQPQVGDIVEFIPDKYPDMTYIGVIADISDKYTIVNKLNSTNPWIVNRQNIVSHIYFPKLNLPVIVDNLLPTSTLIPTPTTVPTLTPVPTRRPTLKPTLKPTQNVVVPTSLPVQSSNNNFYCFINAQAQNEGVPATYNLVCGVGNLGSATSAEFQWDYNGDGNWDSGFSQSNCSTNYTYSTAGIYNIKMKAKTPDGQTAECSTQVAVQPH